jgi:hypothetical protein
VGWITASSGSFSNDAIAELTNLTVGWNGNDETIGPAEKESEEPSRLSCGGGIKGAFAGLGNRMIYADAWTSRG